MYENLYDDFLTSNHTLRVYEDGSLLFSSEKDGLLPLVEYLKSGSRPERIVIFDNVTGNAAALLSALAGCTEVFSPLGSELAVKTLEKHSINYHISETVAYIQKPNSEEMCPMEKLSLEKEPDEFYKALMEILS